MTEDLRALFQATELAQRSFQGLVVAKCPEVDVVTLNNFSVNFERKNVTVQ